MLNRLTSLKVLILLICCVISLHLARCMSATAGAQKVVHGKKSAARISTTMKQ
jgi:hypothetical protein